MSRIKLISSLFLITVTVLLSSCANEDGLSKVARSELFVQDYNPENLDILWVVDDRSPLNKIRTQLTSQASQFFTRLDQTPRNYRMAITNVNNGSLLPASSPVIITPNVGTLTERTQFFSNLIYQTINLATAAWNRGFASAYYALTQDFIPRANVPLVLVFVSDTDDYSPTPGAVDSVNFYSQQFINMKGGDPKLVRGYSINYRPLAAGETINTSNRCTTHFYDADIDQPGFKNSYYRMAQALGGDKGDLCASWAGSIDLSGLRLQTLATEFTLAGNPASASAIIVAVTDANGNSLTIPWIYVPETRKIVFQTAPPEGAKIQVNY